MEELERRDVPTTFSVLTVGGTATFTDANSNIVTIRVNGTSGTATFTDSASGAIDDGDNIANVAISSTASPNFRITYSVNGAATTGNVLMGNILSPVAIRGIYTVTDNTTPVSFELASFKAPSLSSFGSLNADFVTGNVAGVGIDLGSLGVDRVINIRNSITSDVLFRGAVSGTINVGTGGVSSASDWRFVGVTGSTAQIAVGSSFDGTFNAVTDFAGTVSIDGGASGIWLFQGLVKPRASLNAASWSDVRAQGANFNGEINATTSSLKLTVSGSVNANALINTTDELTLSVTGNVNKGAIIGASGSTLTVGGNFLGRIHDDSSIDATILGGVMTGARIVADDQLSMTVGADVSGARFQAGSMTLSVAGSLLDSHLYATDSMSIAVNTDVLRSTVQNTSVDMTLSIGRNLTNSNVTCGSEDVSLTVGGNVLNSTVFSNESSVTMSVTGSVQNSTISGGSSSVSLTVGAGLINSTVIAGNEVFLTLTGALQNSRIEASGITAAIAGNIQSSRLIFDESNATLSVTGSIVSSKIINLSSSLTVTVGGSITSSVLAVGDGLKATVGGSITDSDLSADSSDVSLTVTGNVVNSSLASGNSGVTLGVGGNVQGTTIAVTNDSSISIGLGFTSNTFVQPDGSLTLTVGGVMNSRVLTQGSISASVGTLQGTLTGENIDLTVSGNVSSSGRINAKISVDNLDVTGNFHGILNTNDLNDSGTLIGGSVGTTGQINVARTFGNGAITFGTAGTNFLGLLSIGSNLDQALTFAGDAYRVVIGGQVRNDISVGGKLNFLSSGSLFDDTDAFSGVFVDGLGTQTGTLATVNGYTTVIPTA